MKIYLLLLILLIPLVSGSDDNLSINYGKYYETGEYLPFAVNEQGAQIFDINMLNVSVGNLTLIDNGCIVFTDGSIQCSVSAVNRSDWHQITSKPFSYLTQDFQVDSDYLNVNGTWMNATIRTIANQDNLTIVNYKGLNASGIDGATSRVLNVTKFADMIALDNVLLQPVLDYVSTIGQVLFYVSLNDTSNITVWSLRAGSTIANVSSVLAQNVFLQDIAEFYNGTQAEGAFAEIGNRLGQLSTGNYTTVWRDPVKSKTVATPPVAPDTDDRYIVPYAVAGDWYGAAGEWNYRQKITLESDYVLSNKTNFAISLKIDDALNSVFSHALDNGNDIVFVYQDKTTKMPHELVSFNTTSGYEFLEAYVNVTMLNTSTDTTIYMYYGNAAATPQESRESVWESDYKGVFHADMYNSSHFNDSTSNNYFAQSFGYPDQLDGIMGKAQYYDGVNDYANTTIDTKLSDGSFTVSAWLKDTNTGSQYIMAQAHTTGGYSSDWIYGYGLNGIWMRSKIITGGNIMADGDWHKMDVVFDGTTLYLYIDGELYGTPVTPTGYGAVSSLYMFTRGDTLYRYKGTIDEIRISTTNRSAEWINLTYNMIKNYDTFATFGVEEISSATATEWTGNIDSITQYNGSNWTFSVPSEGWATTVLDENLQYWWNGSDWIIVTSGIQHKILPDLVGCDTEGNCVHFETVAQMIAATRLATNVQSGLMPGGKLDYWDSSFHAGDSLTSDLFIETATPQLVLQDSDDDTAYSIFYDTGNDYLNITYGSVTEGTYTGVKDSAKVFIDGTVRSTSSVVTGSSYSGETISGQANLIMYILSGTTARILPFDGSSYYDLAIGDWGGGNPNIMLKTGGNVGINKGTPSSTLDVGGTIKSDKDINASNVVCDGDGNCLNTVNTYNTSAQMVTGANTTNLLINWNSTGLIRNWSGVGDTNESTRIGLLETALSNNATKLDLLNETVKLINFIVDTNLSHGGGIDGHIVTNSTLKTSNSIANEFAIAQSVWAFKYADGTGADNTGLYFNMSSVAIEFKILGATKMSVNIAGLFKTGDGYFGNTGDSSIFMSPNGDNTGELEWGEDEDYFIMHDDILMDSTSTIMFNTQENNISSNGYDMFINTDHTLILDSNVNVTGDLYIDYLNAKTFASNTIVVNDTNFVVSRPFGGSVKVSIGQGNSDGVGDMLTVNGSTLIKDDLNATGDVTFGGDVKVFGNINGTTLYSNATCTILSSPDGSNTFEVCNV